MKKIELLSDISSRMRVLKKHIEYCDSVLSYEKERDTLNILRNEKRDCEHELKVYDYCLNEICNLEN